MKGYFFIEYVLEFSVLLLKEVYGWPHNEGRSIDKKLIA